MANTPKYIRKVAKSHAQAQRDGDHFGKGGARTTELTKAIPNRFPTVEDFKKNSYIPKYSVKNSNAPKRDQEFHIARINASVGHYKDMLEESAQNRSS